MRTTPGKRGVLARAALAWLALAAATLAGPAAWAGESVGAAEVGAGKTVRLGSGADDPCKENSDGSPVPQCVTQAHSDTLSHDQTQDIDIYCPGNAPYYWGGWIDSFSSIWHVITENLITSDRFHAHFKISNTRLGSNSYTVTIGCSPLSETGQCTGTVKTVKDPQCPHSSDRQDCTGAPAPRCWSVWSETCVNGNTVTNYNCTNASPLSTTCVTCNG